MALGNSPLSATHGNTASGCRVRGSLQVAWSCVETALSVGLRWLLQLSVHVCTVCPCLCLWLALLLVGGLGDLKGVWTFLGMRNLLASAVGAASAVAQTGSNRLVMCIRCQRRGCPLALSTGELRPSRTSDPSRPCFLYKVGFFVGLMP